MHVKDIAVVSSNSVLIRFFELECRILGNTVHSFSKMPSHTEGYSHIFVDVDTVRHVGVDRASVITVSKGAAQKEGTRHLTWPVSLEEIREMLTDAPAVTVPIKDIGEDCEPVLWIQSRERRELRYEKQSVALSQGEFLLLEALADAQKEPVRRETLMRLFEAETGNIADVYVCHLRKKLERLCERRVIDTVRGVGYCLKFSLRDAEKE